MPDNISPKLFIPVEHLRKVQIDNEQWLKDYLNNPEQTEKANIWRVHNKSTGENYYYYYAWGEWNRYNTEKELYADINSGTKDSIWEIRDEAEQSCFINYQAGWFQNSFQVIKEREQALAILEQKYNKQASWNKTFAGTVSVIALAPTVLALANGVSKLSKLEINQEWWKNTATPAITLFEVSMNVGVAYGISRESGSSAFGVVFASLTGLLTQIKTAHSGEFTPDSYFSVIAGTKYNYVVEDMLRAPDGSYYFTGYVNLKNNYTYSDILFGKSTPEHQVEILTSIRGNASAIATSLALMPDSSIMLGGTVFYPAADIFNRINRPLLINVKANGEVKWAKTFIAPYNSTTYQQDDFDSVTVNPVGNIAFTGASGYAINGEGVYNLLAGEVSPAGDLRWANNWPGDYSTRGQNIKVKVVKESTASYEYVIVGQSNLATEILHLASDGQLIDAHILATPEYMESCLYDVERIDNGWIGTGNAANFNFTSGVLSSDVYVVKFSDDLATVEFAVTLGEAKEGYFNIGNHVAPTEQSYLIGGSTTDPNNVNTPPEAMYLAEINQEGELISSRVLGREGRLPIGIYKIFSNKDGSFETGGTANAGPTSTDYSIAVAKFAADGTIDNCPALKPAPWILHHFTKTEVTATKPETIPWDRKPVNFPVETTPLVDNKQLDGCTIKDKPIFLKRKPEKQAQLIVRTSAKNKLRF